MKRILSVMLCGLLLVGFFSVTMPMTGASGDLSEERVADKVVEENHVLTTEKAIERGPGIPKKKDSTDQSSPNQASEFVVIGGDDGVLFHFLSYGNGTFGPMNEIGNARDDDAAVISYIDFANIAIADFDNDNDFDFVAGTGGALKRIYLFTNDGSGNFNRTMIFEQACYCVKFYQDFATADFDGDGYYDFVASGSPHGHIYVFINNQDQTFTLKSMIDQTCFTGLSAGIDTGDFNEDGKMDFLVTDYGYDRETQQAHMYLGNGNGTFKLKKDAIVLSGIGAGGNGELWAITTGDFNNDGHFDAIVGQDDDYDPGQTYLFVGDGSGDFSYYGEAYDLYPSIESGKDLEGIGYIDAFDFDHDGNLDVVCADRGSATQYTGKFWFVKGDGDGTFQTPKLIYNFGDFIPVMGISAQPYQLEGEMPPDADAGPDQTVYEGDIVQFDGANSTGSVINQIFGFGQNVQVNNDIGTAYQFYPSIAVDDLGYIHIVWMDNRSGEWEAYYAISFDGGKTFSNTQIPFSTGSAWARQPAIGVDANGTAHIVFAGVNESGYSDIYYTFTADFGQTFATNVKVTTGDEPVDPQHYPDLAVSDTGEIYIAWFDPRGIFFSRSTDGFSTNLKVNDPGNYGTLFPSIAVDKDGNISIVWSDDRNSAPHTTDWDIYATTSTDGGVSFSSDVRVDDDNTTRDQNHPEISGGESGEFFVVWEDRRRSLGGDDIFLAKSNNSGASFEPNVQVNDETTSRQYSPSVAVSQNGDIHVSWWDKRNGKWDVYYSNSGDGGKTFSKNLRIDDAISEKIPIPDSVYVWYKATDITVDSFGNPHIVWHDKRNGNFDIYYARGNVIEGEEAQIVSWEWDFDANVDSDGNGNPTDDVDANGPKPTHIYGDDGVYTVTLTVMDDKGLSDTDTMLVKVNNVAPTIMSTEASVYVNFTLRIAGEKWHNVEMYIYENGAEIGYVEVIRYPGSPEDQSVTIVNVKCDATKTITITVLYTPDDDPVSGQPIGAYPCWVNITFEDGSYELLHNTFNVNHPETWIWNIEFNQYLVGHEITFVATANDPGNDDLKFTWNWGDGTSDTKTTYYNDGLGSDPYPSPEGIFPFNVTDEKKHKYTVAENYIVTMTVTDDDGGVDSDIATVTINNVVPIAHAGGPYFVNEGEGVTYTGTQTAPCISGDFIYYWDFGDGSSSTKQNPTHIYAIYGKYTVRFIVTSEYGDIDFDICDVYVNANPIANAGSDQTVYEGDIVEFDGGGSYDLDGNIISYEWDFDANVDMDDDGNSINDADAIGPSVQHTYDAEGEYQVTLTVTDGFSSGLTTLKVTVLPNAPPVEDEEQGQEEDLEENIEDIEDEQDENEEDETSDISEDLNEDIENDLEPIVNDDVDLPDLPPETKEIDHDDFDDDKPVKPQTQPLEAPKKDDKPDFPLHTITISISSIIISTLSLSLPLYMKINRKDLLKNRKRKLIYKYISTNPGDNFNGIKQALSLPNGVLTYHLKILERENFVISKRDGGYKRFYISGKSKMNNIKKLNGVQKDIFNTIRNFPGISQTEIAKKNGTTVQVVNYHIKRLQEDGLITLQMTNGHRSQCYLQNCENIALT